VLIADAVRLELVEWCRPAQGNLRGSALLLSAKEALLLKLGFTYLFCSMVLVTIVCFRYTAMRVFVTDEFQRFMRKAKLTDSIVLKAATELNNGLHDGDLDMGKLFKKRIASPGQGKRNSNRSIVAVVKDEKLFFIDGWRKADIPKSGKEIPDKLLEGYRLLGNSFRNFTEEQIQKNLAECLLREVISD